MTPRMQRKSLLSLIALLCFGLLIALAHHLAPLLQPASETLLVPDCDLQRQRCSADLPGVGTVSLEISPRPIAPLHPFILDVAAPALATPSSVEFTGVNMDMGLNRVELKMLAPGRYQGSGSLPVCTSGRMEWRATVLIEHAGRRFALPFRFFSPD